MNYNSIVERFKEIVTDHNQLQDFGYGNLSDIKTRSEGGTTTNTDYPYLFVNPTSHSRGTRSVTYNFNLIVMDMAKDDNFLKIQSECQQYIDDVLARLRFHYTDQVDLLLTNITLTPFKERFQDTVAGMTATISIEVPLPLNECIAPFVSPEPTYTLLVTAEQTTSFNDLTLAGQAALGWVSDGSTLNDGNWDDYEYSPQTDKPYKWVFTGRVQFYGGGDLGEAYEVRDKAYGENTPATTSNWPTNPTVAQMYEFEMVWEGIQRQPQSWPFGLEIVAAAGTNTQFQLYATELNIYVQD